MTPLEALHQISRVAATGRLRAVLDGRLRPDVVADVHLLVCDGCAHALLTQLDGLFRPTTHDHTRTLADSQVMGCTFGEGAADQCALHDLLREDAVCP